MPARPKKTWYERQRERKANPFFRLVDRSFFFRLLVAALSALILLGTVHRFEVCRAKNYSPECEFADILSVITVGNLESFSIVTAAILYILERGQSKRQEHALMWETISYAKEARALRSIGRIIAIETLSRDGLWLDGQDFQGAILESLDVPDARLRGVNFSRAVLTDANFAGADLVGASFEKADLRKANLTGANLTGANLTSSNLTGANFTNADLTNADLTGAEITDIKLNNARLAGARIDKQSFS